MKYLYATKLASSKIKKVYNQLTPQNNIKNKK